MKLVIDGPHGFEQIAKRGIDLSMLMAEQLKQDLKELLAGQRLTKEHNGTTLVFKKSNSSDTVFIKTGWAKYKPLNNPSYKEKDGSA